MTYLESADSFLQYSAIHQLKRFKEQDVLDVLSSAVTSEKIEASNLETADHTITARGTQHSADLLKNIAENQALALKVRTESVFTFQFLPGGIAQLNQWARGQDKDLKGAAKAALAKHELMAK